MNLLQGLAGVWTYFHNDEGNQVKKARIADGRTWSFAYDHMNHLTQAEERVTDGGPLIQRFSVRYDVFGNRIEESLFTASTGMTETTRFGIDGQEIWVDVDINGALLIRYINGDVIDQRIARITASTGASHWYLTDIHGSVREIVTNDLTPTIVKQAAYDGFGNATVTTSLIVDRFQYTGRDYNLATGLQYIATAGTTQSRADG